MRFGEVAPFDISRAHVHSAMLLYYITDRQQFEGTEAERRRRLIAKIAEAAAAGVDLVQLRERDLTCRALENLAAEALTAVRSAGHRTRLLINSRVDVALAVGADGVHLRSSDIGASEARAIASARPQFIVGVSCHTGEEVRAAWSHGADFAVFAPVFEKDGRRGAGVKALKEVCKATPNFVIALGGVTERNAAACVAAGARGIAGMRLYQGYDISRLVEKFRQTEKEFPKKG